ncbi:MAG: HNH endonuclease [Paludibacter sp.]|nr:HNH endonuclease [Paludibacter sp.]
MGFSLEIRQKVMLASARHCCVCHRYKGVKIEVHHIKQEADGGPNTFENAIALCFDCHSDAGHFNDRHPRGTKFSKKELIVARDIWYETIKSKPSIEKLIVSNKIHASYFVLHSFEILESVIKNDFSSVNKYRNIVYLSSNAISNQWINLLKTHELDYEYNIDQNVIIELGQFSTLNDYCQKYDNVQIIDRAGVDYPYYIAKREIKWTEIDSILPNSFLREISKSGIEPKYFCTSVLKENGVTCGDAVPTLAFTEYLEIAPISFIFLGITNASKEPLKLNSLTTSDAGGIFNLPKFNLLPYEMVLMPISTAINLSSIDNNGIVINHIDGDRGQDFSRILNSYNFNDKYVKFFEKKINPRTIIFNDNEGEYEIEIHEFDFNNIYSINSYWECGSCPHLFLVDNSGQQRYSRELLVSSSFKKGSDSFVVPKDIYQIVIRELEDEITYIDKIIVNELIVVESNSLGKGEKIVVNVKPFDKVKIKGHYEPFFKTNPKLNDLWYRNEMIKLSNNVVNNKIDGHC